MNATRLLLVILAGTGALWQGAGARTFAQDTTAPQLIAKVLDASRTTGLRVRSKLILLAPGSEHRDTKQLLIKNRSDGKTTETLYQVLWPAEAKGQALLIHKSAEHQVSGFLFEPPDKVRSLTPKLMAQPFFGSDLAIEDLAEDYWHWPSQKITGEESVRQRTCKIIESRPPAGSSSSYSLVRTWVSPEIALPLLIEKFGKDHQLVKRITVDKIVKQSSDRWAAATVIIEPAGGHSRTIIEGSKAERDIDIPAEDFTMEKIKNSLRSSP